MIVLTPRWIVLGTGSDSIKVSMKLVVPQNPIFTEFYTTGSLLLCIYGQNGQDRILFDALLHPVVFDIACNCWNKDRALRVSYIAYISFIMS